MRGKADSNNWANDSVFVQFDASVDANGAAMWRIGTTSAAEYNLEDCSGCGLSGWGWQDNGWGVDALGPVVYFAADGPQTLRVQTREDGLAIDQVVLSPDAYLNSSPGSLKNDTTILDSRSKVDDSCRCRLFRRRESARSILARSARAATSSSIG